MDLQQCLVLTAASGAVLMDLKTGEIANGWIVILWLAGFLTNGMGHGMRGILSFLIGTVLPILLLFWLFHFRILKCICLSLIFGAILSIGIFIICGNIRQRLFKLTTYIKHIFLLKIQGKTTVPVPYRDGKWGMECIHFSVPILLAVLLWIGGFY